MPRWLGDMGAAILGLLIGIALVWFAGCGSDSSARRRPTTTTVSEPSTLPPTTTLPPGELEAPVE